MSEQRIEEMSKFFDGFNEGFYHYDTPFSVQTQIDLLNEAGFSKVTFVLCRRLFGGKWYGGYNS